jgi:hypothetical protein
MHSFDLVSRGQGPALTRRLIEPFTSDYEAFLARYGDVVRARPEMSPVVRQRTEAAAGPGRRCPLASWHASRDGEMSRGACSPP